MTSARTDLELAFAIPGRVFRGDDGEAIAVRVEAVGELVLDGVAVGDPLASELMELTPPQGRLTGRARVELAVARWPNGDERVAAARVVRTDRSVARWVEAGASIEVDAGTAGFASPAASAGLATEEGSAALLAALEAGDRGGWSAAQVEVAGPAAVGFSCGWGDGLYAASWGLDAQGQAVALALDFEVLVGQVFERFVIPRPRGRGRVQAPELSARGVELRVPWLASRWLEVCTKGLPAGHAAYVRVVRAGEAGDGWIRHQFIGPIGSPRLRVDLEEVPADAALAVRIVTGQRPLPLA